MLKRRLLSILRFSFFLGLGIFLVWWSIRQMGSKNWTDCKAALKSANYYLFIPVFFILTLSHVSRTIRWKILMKPMGYYPGFTNTFSAVMVGYLANLAVPRLGEVLKCTILDRYEKVPAEKLIGTILVERAIDIVSLVVVFIIALIAQATIIGNYAVNVLQEKVLSYSLQTILIRAGIAIVLVSIVYLTVKFLFRKYRENRFVKKTNHLIKGIGIGLKSVKYLQNKWWFIFHSVLIWSCYVAGTYIGFYAIDETAHLPFAAAFPILAFGSIGMIITPGGIGTYPLFVMQVMSLYNIEEGYGFANGTLQWLAQFVIILLVGFITLIILPIHNKKIHREKHTGYSE